MLVKTLKRTGIGFLIGIAIGYIISILTGLDNPEVFIPVPDQLLKIAGSLPFALILQGLFSGLYGALCFGCMSFYEIESWPLSAATAAHCSVIILTFIPVAFFLGWVSSLIEILIISSIQLVAFFIIWLIMWSIYKMQVKELNKMQENLKKNKKS